MRRNHAIGEILKDEVEWVRLAWSSKHGVEVYKKYQKMIKHVCESYLLWQKYCADRRNRRRNRRRKHEKAYTRKLLYIYPSMKGQLLQHCKHCKQVKQSNRYNFLAVKSRSMWRNWPKVSSLLDSAGATINLFHQGTASWMVPTALTNAFLNGRSQYFARVATSSNAAHPTKTGKDQKRKRHKQDPATNVQSVTRVVIGSWNLQQRSCFECSHIMYYIIFFIKHFNVCCT